MLKTRLILNAVFILFFVISPAVAAGEAAHKGKLNPHPGDKPIIVWVGGDSLAYGIGEFLSRDLKRQNPPVRIKTFYKPAKGLARMDLFNWDSALRKDLSGTKPSVAIFLVGANDTQNIVTTKNRGIKFGTHAWEQEYGRRVDAVLDILGEEDRSVIWVGLPVMSNAAYQKKIELINTVQKGKVQSRPNFRYVETRTLLAGTEGEYISTKTDSKGKVKQLRASDGIHLSPEGIRIVTQAIIPVLQPCLVSGR